MKQPQTYTVTFEHVEPEVYPLEFEGVHLLLTGNLAFFMRGFTWMVNEEYAVRNLEPWIRVEKNKRLAQIEANRREFEASAAKRNASLQR